MRIPLGKVWRAFPELDTFSDRECEGFVREARRRRPLFAIIVPVAGCVVGFAAWVASAFAIGIVLATVRWPSGNVPDWAHTTAACTILSLFGLLPGFGALVARDRQLRRTVRALLNRTTCGGCNYALLGLTIHDDGSEGGPWVVCPECGKPNYLRVLGVTPEQLIARHESGAA